MLSRVKKFIIGHSLIDRGDLVIVAVSGGPDSVALLHILHQMSPDAGFTLHVAHLNHGLRPEAGQEEVFVRSLSSSLGWPCTSIKVDVQKMAQKSKMSLEEAGREARYSFFRQLQQELGATRVATAHHSGDQAETVLMHLLRGAGLKGLRGITPRRDIFIRPLLNCTKDEIMAYLDANSLQFCTDPSNYSPVFLRNRIRHELLPLLEREYNPGIINNLTQLAVIARDENEIIEAVVDRAWDEAAGRVGDGEITLVLQKFQALPPGVQRRVVLKALGKLRGETGWSMKDVEAVLAISRKEGSNKEIHLPKGIRVQKSYQQMVFYTREKKIRSFRYLLQIPGKTEVKEMQAEVTCVLQDNPPEVRSKDQIYLDWDKLDKPLEIRSRRPGDRLRPLGLGGSKKIQDLLVDAKVPYQERERVGVLACGDQVYGVIGYRIDERAIVDNTTKKVLVLKVESKEVN